MKQKLLLLLAISISMVSSAWADLTQIDGVYQISSADDLVAFAEIVNGGVYDANAVLTTDIDCTSIGSWTPIGSTTSTDTGKYKGTFDGQGHTIRNLTINRTGGCTGLFNTTAGVTLRNFILDSSCSIKDTNASIAGLVGRHQATGGSATATSTFYGIGNAANVTISGTDKENPAGLIGGCWGKKDVNIIIEKCWTSGTITSSSGKAGNCGAFVGWINGGKLQVNNSWSIATVNTAAAAKYLVRPASNENTAVTFTNCRSLNGTQVNTITSSQVTSGELCYLLNGDQATIYWYQTIGTDATPIPFATGGHQQVYKNGTFCPDTDTPRGVFTYGNTDEHVTGEHNWVNAICSYCGYPKADYMTANGEDVFEIGNPIQLKWFAAYVNFIDQDADAKLTTNIDLDGVEWTPIGKSVAYGGTFDGQNFAISNFNYVGSGDYNGLFGKVVNATIKNFSISGALKCAGQGNGTIGWGEGALISNVHSALTITTPASGAVVHGGGIIGDARYGGGTGSTIEFCSFSGTLSVNADSHDCFAGIVGYVNDYCKIDGCANYGTISYAKSNCYIGGILGYVNNTNCYGTHNCLNIGEVTYVGEGDPSYGGAIVGRLRGNDPEKWGNSYWKQGSATQACGENSISKTFEVTAEQLASCEVAYTINKTAGKQIFYQLLGTDAYPGFSGPEVLYVGATGYTTFYDVDNQDRELTGDAQAYIGSLSGKYIRFTEIDDIPAGTAVLISGTPDTYYNAVSTTAASDASSNVLLGSDGSVQGGTGIYALANKSDGVGFYPISSSIYIPAGKAYLEVGAGVKEFYLFSFDEEETGLKDLKDLKDLNDVIYNLSGQRISKLQKGINIVNGKKVLF